MNDLRTRVDPFTVERTGPCRGIRFQGRLALDVLYVGREAEEKARALCVLLNVGYWAGQR